MPAILRTYLAGGMLFWVASIAAFAVSVPEDELKVAFLYKFAQFTVWPTSTETVNFCVYGNDSLSGAFDKLKNKTLRDVPISVSRPVSMAAVKQCQVVYLNSSDQNELARWVGGLADYPILTVSSTINAWESGVIIALVTEPNRLSFKINRSAALAKNLTLGAQMLQLAKEVR